MGDDNLFQLLAKKPARDFYSLPAYVEKCTNMEKVRRIKRVEGGEKRKKIKEKIMIANKLSTSVLYRSSSNTPH